MGVEMARGRRDTCTGVRVNVRGWCATRYYADKIFMVIGAPDRGTPLFFEMNRNGAIPMCRPTQILCPVDDNEDGEGGEGKRKKKGSMDAIVESMWFESNIDNAYLSSIEGKMRFIEHGVL